MNKFPQPIGYLQAKWAISYTWNFKITFCKESWNVVNVPYVQVHTQSTLNTFHGHTFIHVITCIYAIFMDLTWSTVK